MTTLYKKDSKGKIRKLEIFTAGIILYQESGLIDGKTVVHSKVCNPKNVGKKNETTGEEQAEAQAKSLVAKKLREGYFNTQHEAETIAVVKPMLANKYEDGKKKLKGKLIAIQKKLDGVRCIVEYDATTKKANAKTRENVVIDTIDHILMGIEKTLSGVSIPGDKLILDGELYNHGNTFQENTKLVKNKFDINDPITYCVYDIVDTTGVNTFEERTEQLVSLMKDKSKYIDVVETVFQSSPFDEEVESWIKEQFQEAIADGWEGLMVRATKSKYKVNGRSFDLLKYKEFIDTALPIVDITPSEARPTHGTVWVEFNGHLQKTGSKISHEDRKELLTNKSDFIGKTAEIRYFEKTDEGKMRFAYYHGVRIDK